MKQKFVFSIITAFAAFSLILTMAPALAKPAPPPVQTPLNSSKIAQFVDPLPLLSVAGGPIETIVAGSDPITLTMEEFKANVMPTGFVPAAGTYTGTTFWGYRQTAPSGTTQGTYIGPLIIATRNVPTQITYINKLGNTSTSNLLAYTTSTDLSLHWADLMMDPKYVANLTPLPAWLGNSAHYMGSIPAVPHLHGGEQPAAVDGGPDQWFTSDGTMTGSAYYTLEVNTLPALPNSNYPEGTLVRNQADSLYYKVTSGAWVPTTTLDRATFRYPNVLEPALIWFHDHTLGVTRLNVYAGLAGAYDIIDPAFTLPTGLGPIGLVRSAPNVVDDTVVPLVIQDRMFDTNGELFFPNVGINPDHQYWVPEFLGDTIVVNGKVWPYLDVKAQRYRFLLINGSNARTYELSFAVQGQSSKATPMIYQIGTDGGYLDAPVALTKLLIMPGERADFIVDFAGLPVGTTMILENKAKAPYPGGAPPSGSTTGRIMQFRVIAGAVATDDSFNPAVAGTTIRGGFGQAPAIVRLADPTTGNPAAGVTISKTRELTLNEIVLPRNKVNGVQYPGGPVEILVNNTKWTGTQPDANNPNNMTSPPDQSGWTQDGIGNYLSEVPDEGTTEIWEIVNTTMDAHPIHLHLVQFQIMNRQTFDMKGFMMAYNMAFPGGGIDPLTGLPYPQGVYMPSYGPPLSYSPSAASGNKYGGNPDVTPYLVGAVVLPNANEAGWKDTIMVPPGMVTRIVVRWGTQSAAANASATAASFIFIPNGNIQGDSTKFYDYVWHCHIIDHEDNEMMRPDMVNPDATATRTYVMGVDY